MKQLIMFFVLSALIFDSSAQIQKFVSTEQAIVNVDFSVVKGYDDVYLTFNFDTKVITLSNPDKGSKFTFTMISVTKQTGTAIGDAFNIYVTSKSAPAVNRFYFSLGLPTAIFMENNDGKTTTFGGLRRL